MKSCASAADRILGRADADETAATAMPDLNREAGQTIEAQRRALAEAVVARQYQLQPGLRERYGEGGRAKCVQDTEYHLAYLAAAVTYSSPALFCDYIAWAKAVLAAHGVGPEDVAGNLVCLRDVLSEQLPGGMGEAVASYVEAALRTLPEAPTTLPSLLDGEDALSELARQYLQALLRAERHEASRLILDAVRAGVAVGDLYLQVFQRCQREVGRLWQLKQITVAQEHYCTAATQLAMSQLYPYLFALPKKGRRLAAASVGGELHEVGLRIVTDLFEADGWDTLYLGANLPAGSVVQAVEQHRPDLLVISATMTFHLPGVEQLIAQVRSSEACQGVKVMVGGYPFNVDPELWRRVGADGHAPDAGEALDVAARLLNLPEPGERQGPEDLRRRDAGRGREAARDTAAAGGGCRLRRVEPPEQRTADRPAGTGPQERPTGAAQRAAGWRRTSARTSSWRCWPTNSGIRWPRCGTPPCFSNSPAWTTPSLSAPGR